MLPQLPALLSLVRPLFSSGCAAAHLISSHRRPLTACTSRETLVTAADTPGSPAAKKPRVLSGIQPTGILHLGNYLGAIRQWVAHQDLYDNTFCVVDMHAITAPHIPKELAKDTYRTAALYLASGIDPERSRVFVQSHVTAHAELTWMLNCATPIGWLERMIQVG